MGCPPEEIMFLTDVTRGKCCSRRISLTLNVIYINQTEPEPFYLAGSPSEALPALAVTLNSTVDFSTSQRACPELQQPSQH